MNNGRQWMVYSIIQVRGENMHIVVLGAGALGSYFGLRLQEAGANVTFLVRKTRSEHLKRYGLAIHSTQGDFHAEQLHVETDPVNIKCPDILLVSVKGYHLAGAMDQIRTIADKGAYVLPVLNGIEHLEVLQKEIGKKKVLGGLSFIIATLNKQGHVEHTSDFHKLIFGPLHPEQAEICSRLEKLTNKANVTGRNTDNILYELWKKYMFITAFSGITTAVRLPIGKIRESEETFHIAKRILKEMKLLANVYNVNITDKDVAEAIENMQQFNAGATSSMHQDLRKRLTLELEHLHGGAIRLGKAKQLDLVYTKIIYGLIKPFENLNERVCSTRQ